MRPSLLLFGGGTNSDGFNQRMSTPLDGSWCEPPAKVLAQVKSSSGWLKTNCCRYMPIRQPEMSFGCDQGFQRAAFTKSWLHIECSSSSVCSENQPEEDDATASVECTLSCKMGTMKVVKFLYCVCTPFCRPTALTLSE